MAMRSFLGALDRYDRALSRPIQFLVLPAAVERVLGFPNGELIFDPKLLFPTVVPGLIIGQLVFGAENLVASGVTMLVWTAVMILTLKVFAFKRQRPQPGLLKTPKRSIDVRSHVTARGADNTSFPSGCSAAGTATAVFAYAWAGSPYWLLIIPLSCFVRVYFCCHCTASQTSPSFWISRLFITPHTPCPVLYMLTMRIGCLSMLAIRCNDYNDRSMSSGLGDTLAGVAVGLAVVSALSILSDGLHTIDFAHPLLWSGVAACGLFVLALKRLKPTTGA